MSGYQALRVADDDGSRNAPGGFSGWRGGQTDSPMVLARVADFRSVSDEPGDETLDEPHDEPATGREPHWLAAVAACKSRVAVAGLMVAAGLFGFALGRWTSPDPPEDPQAWSPNVPAPLASEAPTWNGQRSATVEPLAAGQSESPRFVPTATGGQSAVGNGGSGPGAWGPPPTVAPATSEKTAEPNWGQSPPTGPDLSANEQTNRQTPPGPQTPGAQPPWSPVGGAPADRSGSPRWTANQGMTLPAAGPAGPPTDGRRVESDPYVAARMAQRPSLPAQSSGVADPSLAPPNMQRSWPPGVQSDARPPIEPNGQWPAGVPRDPPARDYTTSGASYGSVPSGGYSNGSYPSAGYPNTGYPNAYPQTNQAIPR